MRFFLKVIMFFLVVLSIWVSLNCCFLWRLFSLPLFGAKTTKIVITSFVIFFALSYIVGRIFIHRGFRGFASFLEVVGAVWIGALFILVVYLFFADVISLFGYFKTASIYLRYLSLLISAVLVFLSLYLGLRTPLIRNETIKVSNPQLSGLKIVQISDLHLGEIKGERFLKKVVKQINEQNPDVVVITGDIIDSDGKNEEKIKSIFREIKAKKGVYGVLGNHEYYFGADKNLSFFEESGIKILRNENIEIKEGLLIAGIDDLSFKRESQQKEDFLEKALENRKSGYTVLLSHSPLEVEKAAEMGVNLMLSGHCHNGQIWPFKFLSKIFYPYNYGRFKVKEMDLIVTSGSGTWGPPMRLFKAGEIVVINLL